jgi:mannose-6-phosphate isomerase-like protein (cupin superfamily)
MTTDMTARTARHDVETLSAAGTVFRIIDDGAASGGRLAIFECELDPGWAGPPPHIHWEQDETFYVMTGEVRVARGDESFLVGPGQVVSVARGEVHTFGNAAPDVPARLVCTVSPASALDYFRDLAALPTDAAGRVEPAGLLALMDAHASEPAARRP